MPPLDAVVITAGIILVFIKKTREGLTFLFFIFCLLRADNVCVFFFYCEEYFFCFLLGWFICLVFFCWVFFIGQFLSSGFYSRGRNLLSLPILKKNKGMKNTHRTATHETSVCCAKST